jgi:DNA-binding winged helix-turn-helix (wHTH) protein
MQGGPIFRFGDFELDVEARELRRRGQKIRLAPQPFRLLAMLAASEGRVIDRDAIRKELWDSTHVDFEHGVNFCVREIRRALRDQAGRPKYIETLPRQGYRFLAPIESANGKSSASPLMTARVELADRLAEGRRLLHEMGVGTLDQARKIFEEALGLDPDCAIAHSGLGATRAMRFISRCEPGDLNVARFHLERATELDPELAEPYPWLCYVYFRCGELDKSLEFGKRGVLLLPNLVHAQYFLGTVYYSTCETGARKYPEALAHLLEASRIEPRWLPTWVVLSLLCLMNGEYQAAAAFAQQLFHLQGSDGPVTRFPGAENLMGSISLRKGDAEGAYGWFSRSMATLSMSNHSYAEGMKAWCACGLGDVELRLGNASAALGHYRLAWQIAQESPAMLGQERHAARAHTGLAAAYAVAGEFDRAVHLLSRSEQTVPSCVSLKINTPAMHLADLHHAFAVAFVRVRAPERAVAYLRNAIHSGWHDEAWLVRDTEMEPLHAIPEFWSLIAEIKSVKCPLGLDGPYVDERLTRSQTLS